MEKILEVKGLTFAYDPTGYALKDINVSIYEKEKIAVLGANGAGKSTFFLNLNGVREPMQGEIYFKGAIIEKKKKIQLRKHVGIIFQDPDSQIIASTVKAEVAFGPMNMKLSREEVEKRTLKAIREMNLENYILRPPHYLSGGEKKRVSIADILAMDCEIMIFDEPTASLDPVNAQMLEAVLDKMEKEGRTILLSTHDVDFAYRFAKRILVFCDGRLIGDDTPENIFGNEELLKRANLKKPVFMDIYELLRKKGIVEDSSHFPKQLSELELLLQ